MNGFAPRGVASRALVMLVLCSILLLALPLFAADASPRVAILLTIDNDAWTSDLLVSDALGDTSMVLDDKVGGLPPFELHDGDSAIVRDFGALNTAAVTLRRVRILTGDASLMTQATFRDAAGDFNTVPIDELTTSLPAGGGSDYLRFSRIESTTARSTYVALIADTPQFVELSVIDGDGTHVDSEDLYLERGFTWYALTPDVDIGSLELRRSRHFTCPGCDGELYAVAFVGYRSGGSPRVEMPHLLTSLAP